MLTTKAAVLAMPVVLAGAVLVETATAGRAAGLETSVEASVKARGCTALRFEPLGGARETRVLIVEDCAAAGVFAVLGTAVPPAPVTVKDRFGPIARGGETTNVDIARGTCVRGKAALPGTYVLSSALGTASEVSYGQGLYQIVAVVGDKLVTSAPDPKVKCSADEP